MHFPFHTFGVISGTAGGEGGREQPANNNKKIMIVFIAIFPMCGSHDR